MHQHASWQASADDALLSSLWPPNPFGKHPLAVQASAGNILRQNLKRCCTLPGDGKRPSFHVVAPSLPGFGFSSAPTEAGFGVIKTAETFNQLMLALGYPKYVAQGPSPSLCTKKFGSHVSPSDPWGCIICDVHVFGPQRFQVKKSLVLTPALD